MTETAPRSVAARCYIAGGGPAGMMLGRLLARSGVEVAVLEKHADFLRDFRGDTIHPSTLEVMHELGILDTLIALPHQRAPVLKAQFGEVSLEIADFSHLPTRCKYIAMMPQWDFLNLLASEATRYPSFSLYMDAEASTLIEENGRVVGVRASTPQGELRVRADLVVAADGRHSVLRNAAALAIEQLGAPMDVLWFRLSRMPGDSEEPMGRFGSGHIFIMINRGDYWRCGFVIRKNSIDAVRAQGLAAFRGSVSKAAPFMSERVCELREWNDIKLLTVAVDRMPRGRHVACGSSR